jgi:hypothetical protein
MLKKQIMTLWMLFLSISSYVASANITDRYNEYEIYNKLVGLHKNNALTEGNLKLLTNQSFAESYDELVRVLAEEKQSLQTRIDREKLVRASENVSSRVANYCIGLCGSIPLGMAMGKLLSIVFIAMLPENGVTVQQNVFHHDSFVKNSSLLGISNVVSEVRVIRLPLTKDQFKTFMIALGGLIGMVGAYSNAAGLYNYYTIIKKLESEVQDIDSINTQLTALHANYC